MYTKRVYPILVARLGNPKPIQVLRRRMLAKADGAVLELGFGSGVNLDYYDSERITRLYALEPNKGMTEIAEKHPREQRFTSRSSTFLGNKFPSRISPSIPPSPPLRCVRSRILRRSSVVLHAF